MDTKEVNNFSKKFNKSSRAFLAQKCSNKNGSYVVLAEFGERRRFGAVMIPKGRSREGWQSFAMVCEELISVLGELRRKRVRLVDSVIRQGVSFAQMVRSSPLEKKVAGERETRDTQVDTSKMKMKLTFGVPKEPHADSVEGLMFSKSNNLTGAPIVTAGADGVLWEHLMRLKAELDRLIGLAKNSKMVLEPSKPLSC